MNRRRISTPGRPTRRLPLLAGLGFTILIFSSCTASFAPVPGTACLPTPPPRIAAPDPMNGASAAATDAESCAVSPGTSVEPGNAEILKTFDQVIGELDFYVAYSQKLGIPLTGRENKELIRAIDEWLGVRYRWGGCSKNGVDCSCLIKSIYETVYGIQLNRSSRDMFYEDLTPVDPEDLQEGDILTFKIRGNRISHVGLYLKDQKFVHASRTQGVTIDDLTSPYFRKRFYAGGRVRGDLARMHRPGADDGKAASRGVSLTSPSAALAFALKEDDFH